MRSSRAEYLDEVRRYLKSSPTILSFRFQPASTPEEQKERYAQYTDVATAVGGTFMGFSRICDGCDATLEYIIDVPRCIECRATYDLCKECRDFGVSQSKCPANYGCSKTLPNRRSGDLWLPIDSFAQSICDRFLITREELDQLLREGN